MNKTLIYTIVFVVVFLVAFKVVSLYVSQPAAQQQHTGPPEPGDPIMAQVVCQKAARTQLKAPATATFGQVTPESLGSARYRITGPVDAENSYGALLRMTYDCTMQFTGGDSYRIEHIALTEP